MLFHPRMCTWWPISISRSQWAGYNQYQYLGALNLPMSVIESLLVISAHLKSSGSTAQAALTHCRKYCLFLKLSRCLLWCLIYAVRNKRALLPAEDICTCSALALLLLARRQSRKRVSVLIPKCLTTPSCKEVGEMSHNCPQPSRQTLCVQTQTSDGSK